MKSRDAYMADFVFACVVRFGLYGGLMAILAIMLANCTFSGPQDLLSNRPAVKSPLGDDQEYGTRNRQPQGGCDEKSGTAPKQPLERLPSAAS